MAAILDSIAIDTKIASSFPKRDILKDTKNFKLLFSFLIPGRELIVALQFHYGPSIYSS